MDQVRVGIIGAGMAGSAHARGYTRAEGARVLSIYDTDESKAQRLARAVDAEISINLDSLLGGDLDAVSICTPHTLHAEQAIAAARAGVHVLLEKPMAVTLEGAEKILAACRENGTRLMMGMTHRFYPELQEAERLIAGGAIGRIYMAADRMTFSTEGFLPWVFQRETAGGGVWLENGIHGVDRLRWLVGAEVEEALARVGSFTMEADTEDNGMALLRFRNGVFATMTQAVSPGRHLDCELELYGTDGTIRVRTWEGLTLTTADRDYTRRLRPRMINLWDGIEEGIHREVRQFVGCLQEDRPFPVDGRDGLEELRVVLALYRSSKERKPVKLQSPSGPMDS